MMCFLRPKLQQTLLSYLRRRPIRCSKRNNQRKTKLPLDAEKQHQKHYRGEDPYYLKQSVRTLLSIPLSIRTDTYFVSRSGGRHFQYLERFLGLSLAAETT